MYFVFIGPAVESLKTVEIEKCKKDIAEIREQIYKANKKVADYSTRCVSDLVIKVFDDL